MSSRAKPKACFGGWTDVSPMYPLLVATRGDALAARRMMSSVRPLRLETQIQDAGSRRQPEVGHPVDRP